MNVGAKSLRGLVHSTRSRHLNILSYILSLSSISGRGVLRSLILTDKTVDLTDSFKVSVNFNMLENIAGFQEIL